MGEKSAKIAELEQYLIKVREHQRERQERLNGLEVELLRLEAEMKVLNGAGRTKICPAAELLQAEHQRSSLQRKLAAKRLECEEARAEFERSRKRVSEVVQEMEQLRSEVGS